MRNFDGIIFDIDGTLTETNELIYATFNHVIEKHLNTTYTVPDITSLFGPTAEVIIRELIKENAEEAIEDYFSFYESNHNNMAKAYDGIAEIVIDIKKQRIPLSIYTGKGRRSALITLKQVGLYEYFDMIVTGDDITDHKPSPEGVDLFVEKFNLPRDKVLMIGDAPADIKAARATGIKIASVLWDSYAKDEVLEMGSDYYFNTVEELKTFLLPNGMNN